MSHPSKKKGYTFETECVKVAEAHGFKARRAWASNGKAMDEAEEVDLVVEGIRFQCKRRKKISQEIFPGEDVEGQIIRADYQKCAYVVLPLPLFLNKYMRAYGSRKESENPKRPE